MFEQWPSRPTLAFVAAGWVLVGCTFANVFAHAGPPSTTPGFLRALTPEIASDMRVGQRFAVYHPSLTAIQLHPAASAFVRGTVVLELRDLSVRDAPVVRSQAVAAQDFVKDSTFDFVFAPLSESRGRRYRLEVGSSPTDPTSGVALTASRRRQLEDAMLYFNGRERFGELWFETRIVEPPSRATTPRALGAIALLAGWMSCGMLLGVMRAARRSTSQPIDPRCSS